MKRRYQKPPNTLNQCIAENHKITSAVFVVPEPELPFLVKPRSIHSCVTSPEVVRRYVAVPSNCTQEDIAREEKDRSSPLVDQTSSVSWGKPRMANSLHKEGKIAAKCLVRLEVYMQPVISWHVPTWPSNILPQPRPCLCMWLQPSGAGAFSGEVQPPVSPFE